MCALSLHTSSIIPHFPIRFPFTQHLAWVTEILCTMITHFRGVLKKSLPGLWQVGYINNFCPPLPPACLQASSFLLLLAASFFFDSGQIYESHTRRERWRDQIGRRLINFLLLSLSLARSLFSQCVMLPIIARHMLRVCLQNFALFHLLFHRFNCSLTQFWLSLSSHRSFFCSATILH